MYPVQDGTFHQRNEPGRCKDEQQYGATWSQHHPTCCTSSKANDVWTEWKRFSAHYWRGLFRWYWSLFHGRKSQFFLSKTTIMWFLQVLQYDSLHWWLESIMACRFWANIPVELQQRTLLVQWCYGREPLLPMLYQCTSTTDVYHVHM